MKTLKKYVLLLLVLVITVFTSNAQSTDSTTVYESYIFHKDSVLIYDISLTNTSWSIIAQNEFKFDGDIRLDNSFNQRINNDTYLTLSKKYNKEITLDSISVFYVSNYANVGSYEVNIFNINNGSYFKDSSEIKKSTKMYYTNVKSSAIDILFRPITSIFIMNVTVYYHYTKSNTSINEISLVNDVKFVNNKFETTSEINNIKVYDISGKLIQEGNINNIYQLEKNNLYFLIFDDKYSKKIYITN